MNNYPPTNCFLTLQSSFCKLILQKKSNLSRSSTWSCMFKEGTLHTLRNPSGDWKHFMCRKTNFLSKSRWYCWSCNYFSLIMALTWQSKGQVLSIIIDNKNVTNLRTWQWKTIVLHALHMHSIFGHFKDVLILSATWNDLFCSCVDDVSIWWQMFNFVFLLLKCKFQFNFRIVRTFCKHDDFK